MKINLPKIIGLLTMLWGSIIFAQGPMIPFDITTADLFLTQYGQRKAGPDTTTDFGTSFYKMDVSGPEFVYNQVGNVTPNTIKLNAMGYNPVDNFIYAINVSMVGYPGNSGTRGNLYRIGKDFQIQDMGKVTGLPVTRRIGGDATVVSEYIAGDFDYDGNYYVKATVAGVQGNPRDRIYKINVVNKTSSLITVDSDFVTADFTYNNDGYFYGVDNVDSTSKRFYRFKLTTGNNAAITFYQSFPSANSQGFGAMYSDGFTGTVYGNRNDGGFYRFNKISGVQTSVSASLGSTGNDGANNPLGRIQFNVDLSVTKTDNKLIYIPGTTNVYTIEVQNTGPSGALDAVVKDALPSGIPAANFSWTKRLNSGPASAPVNGAINDVIDLEVGQKMIYTVTLLVPNTYRASLTNTATVEAGPDNIETNLANNSATDTDTLAPCNVAITTQPVSQNLCLGGTAPTLSVVATGTGTKLYQWYQTTNLTNFNGTAIPFATNSTYAPPVTTVGKRFYYVKVTIQGKDFCNINSNIVEVTVNALTAITTQPLTPQNLLQNAPAAPLNVIATGTGTLTYQWYNNGTTNSTSGGTLITGANTSSYTPSTTTVGTTYYYVIVTGTCGSVISAVARVNVTVLPEYCTTGCNENTYVNSIDPNTIEYDNMVGVFHSSMVKESDGKILVWGQGIAFNGTGSTGNVLVPQEVNATNYPGLTGSILKFAAGSDVNQQQFTVLTTTGLFVWGGSLGSLVSPTIKSTNVFGAVAVGTFGGAGTKADGLPAGIAPTDVKMMFGTKNTLAIVTCTGQTWILSTSSNKYGDGSTENAANSAVWHRVKTDATTELAGVIAVRGTVNAMMALTSDGNIYTWGTNTYDGAAAPANRTYATLMTKPAGITPKMIGMTRSNAGVSYYVLATNGTLYSLGKNDAKQLGIFSTTDSNVWVRVQKSAAAGDFFTDITWISPQEHEGGNYAAINILTTGGKLWAWGNSNNGMLGAGTETVDPTYMPGSIAAGPVNPGKLNKTDTLIAVETGGHTTLTIKQCSTKFGYVGHKINGSMADGTTANGTITEYNFSDTASLSICGALAGPVVTDLKICEGTLANLANAEPASLPPGATSIQWFTTITRDPGTQVINTTAVGPGTYYAFYDPLIVTCPSQMTVSYYLPTDPGFNTCVCYDDPATGPAVPTNHGITLLKRAGVDNGNWPMVRSSAFTVLESNIKGFVITRVAKADLGLIAAPQEGMMVYDTTDKCLKLYDGTAWSCFSTPACP